MGSRAIKPKRSSRAREQSAASSFNGEPKERTLAADLAEDRAPEVALEQTRQVEAQYDLTASDLRGLHDGCSASGAGRGCVQFVVEARESHIELSIEDAVGATVGARIKRDLDNNGDWDGEWQRICQSTGLPIPVPPGARIQVLIDPDGCAGRSNPTTGIVTARFFRTLR